MMVAKGHIFKFKTSSSKYLMFLKNRKQYIHLSNLIKTQSVVKTKLTAGAPFQFLCHKPFKHMLARVPHRSPALSKRIKGK